MLFGYDYASYFSSMFIAFSFVLMMCGYAYFAEKKVKLAGYVSVTFAVIYTTIILLVYFAQLTTVRLNDLTQQAAILLDFQQCGLLFNYDLLGYAVMSLATLFAGLTVLSQTKADRWLKYLLMIHIIFQKTGVGGGHQLSFELCRSFFLFFPQPSEHASYLIRRRCPIRNAVQEI